LHHIFFAATLNELKEIMLWANVHV